MRRIALVNQKGGVGKTTTAANLGAALARSGRRVVLVDLDPQGNLSTHLSVEVERRAPSSYGVLAGQCTFKEALYPTRTVGLSIVPTNVDLAGAELELAGEMGRELILREAVDTWEDAARASSGGPPAEYLIFDCPPSLSLLSINALVASREVFIALQTEFLALQGMTRLLDVIGLLQRRLNPSLAVTGIVPCLYDSRLRLAREVLGELRRYFPEQCFRRPIGTNVKLAEAPSYGQSVFEYAPESSGARDYEQLAEEVSEQERLRRPGLDASALVPRAPEPKAASAPVNRPHPAVNRPDAAANRSHAAANRSHAAVDGRTAKDPTNGNRSPSSAGDESARDRSAESEGSSPSEDGLPELPAEAIEVEPGRGAAAG